MKWIVYGAYSRDSAAVPQTIEAPNSACAKKLFLKRCPGMRVIRIQKAAAGETAQKEDWYAREHRRKYL